MPELGPRKKRLLVIDDDESLRELFKLTMEKEGFAVGQAADGVLGLQQVSEFEPDAVIVDLMMPNLSGFEVIHNLQALGFGKIPVIVITGYSEQASEGLILKEPNVIELLKKPINYDALAEIIRGRVK